MQEKAPYNILVVDDDELVAEYLGALLEAENYTAKVMNNSPAALTCFIENPDAFDLVITDQVMPELTGVELAQAMIALRPALPVILITGYSETISAENATSFGLKGFFLKPMDEAELLSKISQLLPQ